MTTNRMGLTPEQAANTFTDAQLESLAHGNNPQSNVYRELLAYRKASKETVAWTDEVELRSVEKDGCGYLFKANPITPHADPRRVIMLYAAPPIQAMTVPDGWIKCIDRMPDVGDIVLTSKDGCVNVGEMERSGANYRYFTSVVSGRELPCTHWMPLPAAPKSVTNEP